MTQRDCVKPFGEDLTLCILSNRELSNTRPSYWNRSVGPLILTALLAPLAWVLMLVGYTVSAFIVLLGFAYKHLISLSEYLKLSLLEQ